MRRAAWALLLVYVFAIPWEHTLDLGAPLGNVARIVGLLLLVVAIPAMLQQGRIRVPGLLLWLVFALYVWFCCTYFWSVDRAETVAKLRAFFQEMMVVWIVWEFAESPRDLRAIFRATVLGCWVLAVLTLVEFRSAEALLAGQMRFAAYGQDPNDVARFLDLGLPIAALLGVTEESWPGRLMAYGYLPAAMLTGLLTGSRGGFLAAVVAVAGVFLILLQGKGRAWRAFLLAIPVLTIGAWILVPAQTLQRLATIPEQLAGGGLNQRFEIWFLGGRAFLRSPVCGVGVGNFALSAGLSPEDTAHNTVLAILVGGGLIALGICLAIVGVAIVCIARTRSRLFLSLATTTAVWAVTAMVATVEESRSTWLLVAVIALSGRFTEACSEDLNTCFSPPSAASKLPVYVTEVEART